MERTVLTWEMENHGVITTRNESRKRALVSRGRRAQREWQGIWECFIHCALGTNNVNSWINNPCHPLKSEIGMPNKPSQTGGLRMHLQRSWGTATTPGTVYGCRQSNTNSEHLISPHVKSFLPPLLTWHYLCKCHDEVFACLIFFLKCVS